MEKSKVYFTDMHTHGESGLLQKLEQLIKTAGIEQIDFKEKFAAIKIHFGEPGNLSFLRPNYAKVVADVIKSLGGKPFLTDCNTLYVGRRKDALEHIEAAYENGFSPFSTGCQVIIADGLKGTDEAYVPVVNGECVKEAKIGRALMDADIIISLSHFKGHELSGFGGAVKNIGMGGGSRAGKMEMHSDGKPIVATELCVGCGVCRKVCAHDAPVIKDKKAVVDQEKCVGCGRCIGECHFNAIQTDWGISADRMNMKMAEYTWAILRGRPHFHISLIIDVSPVCDCHPYNDVPIVPDIGMVASFDPIALDKACADLVNAAPVMKGSSLEKSLADLKENQSPRDHFHAVHPITNWEVSLTHAEKLGLGKKSYELIRI